MNIRIFKLVDGSELVGDAIESRNSFDTYTIKDALEIKYRIGMDGMATAVMTRYNYFGDENIIKLNATGVITSYLVSEKYKKIYEESLETVMKPPKEPENKIAIPEIVVNFVSNNSVH